jgi:hypothetical protein
MRFPAKLHRKPIMLLIAVFFVPMLANGLLMAQRNHRIDSRNVYYLETAFAF